MPEINNNHTKLDEIRSDEVQEILGHIPHWTIRWGIALIFLLILMLASLSWFIKYPDYIEGSIIINTERPPVRLISQGSGQIVNIKFHENQKVKKGDFLAEIKSPLTQEAVSYLSDILVKAKTKVESDYELIELVAEYEEYVFGFIQGEYNHFKANLNELYQVTNNTFYTAKLINIEKQITHYTRLVDISYNKMKLSEQEFNHATTAFKAHKELYDNEVISKMDFFEKESIYLQNKRQLENSKQSHVVNKVTKTEHEKQLLEFKNTIEKSVRSLKEQIFSSIKIIENELNKWQQNYILSAPISGFATALYPISENDFVEQGLDIFAIIPDDTVFVGNMSVASHGFESIKIGQQVLIKLDGFPEQEFGKLKGLVEEKNQIPRMDRQSGQLIYTIKVSIENSKETTYKIPITLKGENTGMAQIITDDKRLINRLFSFLNGKIHR